MTSAVGRDMPVPYAAPARGGDPVGAGLSPPAPDIIAATGTGRDKPVRYEPIIRRRRRRDPGDIS
ncbi:MAG: hypothetical protein OXL38_21565 [Gammaproteobacteria bacterium]|nr:hypothetical protein [Gammaproteobacteria bacterium]